MTDDNQPPASQVPASRAPATNTRAGYVALIGAPNVGKSSLVNALVGEKVSIVSPKAQTTRNRVLGIAIEGDTQLVFMDTPGIFVPKRRLDRSMVHAAFGARDEADAVALMVDCTKKDTFDVIDKLNKAGTDREIVLIVNKIDKILREKLLPLVSSLNERYPFSATFMISALKGDGVPAVREYFARAMPLSPWYFDEDQITDIPDRLLASEITREKLFYRMHDELPYGITVRTDAMEGRDDENAPAITIRQSILVLEKRHKGMVIGKGGAALKAVGTQARIELEKLFGRKVNLFLNVAHDPKWDEDKHEYDRLGLERTS